MRLRRLAIRGFGQLRGNFSIDGGPESVALLLADNESGKSTLAAAIRASLYGLESDRRRSRNKVSEQDRFRPWASGPYGLRLELEHAGREYAIDRDFERNSVRVLCGGEDVTQEFQAGGQIQVGETLTGLTRQQFELSCFVAQGDVVFADASGLSEALQRVAASEGGGSTAARALAVLEEALQQYEGLTLKGRGRVETEIKRCEDEIAAAERALAGLERERRELGAKFDSIHADSERREIFEQRRDILRARRLRSELETLWRAQEDQGELAAKTAALAAQVERETSLRAFDPARVSELVSLREQLSAERRIAEERATAAGDGERHRRELDEKRRALPFLRRPTEADRDTLLMTIQRLEDAQLRQAELRRELEHEGGELQRKGFAVEAAEALVRQFEALPEQERDGIATRGQENLQWAQRRQELDQQLSLGKRRRAEIRQGQQSRKHFGIWCLVVGMLPLMIAITMYAHLPFSHWFLYGAGGGLILMGIGALILGQNFGRREDERLKPQAARQREESANCELEIAVAEQRWQALADRAGLPLETLELRYREWRTVERGVDTLRRLRERMEAAQLQERYALADAARLRELFEFDAKLVALLAQREPLTQALDLYRQLDAVDLQARDAQRRADEAQAKARASEQDLRARLAQVGIALDAGEDLSAGFVALQRRAEAAREARERAQQQLPELQRRLAASGEPQLLRQRSEVVREEIERCETRLRQRASAGAPFDFDEAQLAQGLSSEAFDRGLARLDEEERSERGLDEQDRHEAQHFLIRYEQEAPLWREKLDLHRAARERAVAFSAAIQLAHATLERIAQATHRDWSTALNGELEQLLHGLGSEVSDAVLDEKLRLRLARSGQLLVGEEAQQMLSLGAIERVYLAVRIALARALARGGWRLPLILDDPFANADDQRLVQGLTLLVEAIAPTQQVILMACQNSRYVWARHRLRDPKRLVTLELHELPIADEGRAQP